MLENPRKFTNLSNFVKLFIKFRKYSEFSIKLSLKTIDFRALESRYSRRRWGRKIIWRRRCSVSDPFKIVFYKIDFFCRSEMTVTLSADGRSVGLDDAFRFVSEVKSVLESPQSMMLA